MKGSFIMDPAYPVRGVTVSISSLKVVPGETALAFYTARNSTDKPVTGISTYNVVPFEAGQYFNKIQCFCFEEQILNPNEQVRTPLLCTRSQRAMYACICTFVLYNFWVTPLSFSENVCCKIHMLLHITNSQITLCNIL